ncbi:hypothetical protein [Brasilonema sp. UFV-L1]|nr:hypothetical protein [Brasilonema sp. UFV-L1]
MVLVLSEPYWHIDKVKRNEQQPSSSRARGEKKGLTATLLQ